MKRLLLKLGRLLFFWARRRPIVTAHIQRILVIKLCCLGDVLFTSPLTRALKENFPRARITYLASDWVRELAGALPGVQDTILLDPYTARGWTEKLWRAWQAIRRLRRLRYDAALVLHRSPGASLVAWLGGVRLRIGFDWQGQGFALTHPVVFDPHRHEVDRYLDTLLPLGASSVGDQLELNLPEEAEQYASHVLSEAGFRPGNVPLVAVFPAGGVNPGTTMYSKRWTPQGFREVCAVLGQRYGSRLVFVGGPGDADVADEILGNQSLLPEPIRLEGRASLLQTAAVLKACDLFIGGDSGPLYMADAVGTPTVGLYGPSDPELVAPRGPWHRTVRHEVPCAPCYTPETVMEGQANVCSQGTPACMLELPASEVLRAADELLRKRGFKPR
jgi:lipopolysaccharide heptosyltransferase II